MEKPQEEIREGEDPTRDSLKANLIIYRNKRPNDLDPFCLCIGFGPILYIL